MRWYKFNLVTNIYWTFSWVKYSPHEDDCVDDVYIFATLDNICWSDEQPPRSLRHIKKSLLYHKAMSLFVCEYACETIASKQWTYFPVRLSFINFLNNNFLIYHSTNIQWRNTLLMVDWDYPCDDNTQLTLKTNENQHFLRDNCMKYCVQLSFHEC